MSQRDEDYDRLKKNNGMDMKKITFNDEFGLTESVLEGRKTQTRRMVGGGKIYNSATDEMYHGELSETYKNILVKRFSQYQIGEEFAVAQSYSECNRAACLLDSKGWNNKMFVKADLMPHRIKITNVRVERLQDISEDDCMKEGIMRGEFINTWDEYYFEHGDNHITAKTPCEAYKKLIDRVYGKGTWDSNPWVFVYDFELVK